MPRKQGDRPYLGWRAVDTRSCRVTPMMPPGGRPVRGEKKAMNKALSVAAVCLFAGPAWAQALPRLEEVEVTAQRRPENRAARLPWPSAWSRRTNCAMPASRSRRN